MNDFFALTVSFVVIKGPFVNSKVTGYKLVLFLILKMVQFKFKNITLIHFHTTVVYCG